eukprot:scaffold12491_cov24-Tisochrysis_lutea.AAC.5
MSRPPGAARLWAQGSARPRRGWRQKGCPRGALGARGREAWGAAARIAQRLRATRTAVVQTCGARSVRPSVGGRAARGEGGGVSGRGGAVARVGLGRARRSRRRERLGVRSPGRPRT